MSMSMFKYVSLSLLLLTLIRSIDCRNNATNTSVHRIQSRFFGKQYCYGEFGCFQTVSRCFIVLFGIIGFPVNPKTMNIKFLVFNESGKNDPYEIGYDLNVAKIKQAPIKSTTKIIFIVHGYASNYDKNTWMSDMKDLILAKAAEDYVVFCVDWSTGAAVTNYQVARANVPVVGAVVGVLISKLQRIHEIDLENVHLFGHSLGAHVCGFAGKKVQAITGKKVGWITGMDPAGPCFKDNNDSLRMTDATVVEATHTDMALFGSVHPAGHRDISANGGEMQPPCLPHKFGALENPMDITQTGCDHIFVTKLYTIDYEAFGTCQPIAYACESFEKFLSGECNSCEDNGCQLMAIGFQVGNHEVKPQQTFRNRTMYFKTSKTYPFCSYTYQIVFHYGAYRFANYSFKFAATFAGNRRKTMLTRVQNINEGSKSYFLLEIPEKANNGGPPGPLLTASLVYIWNPNGISYLNITQIEVNYMSSVNETVRKQMSTKLCPHDDDFDVEDIKQRIGKPHKLFTDCAEFNYDYEYISNTAESDDTQILD